MIDDEISRYFYRRGWQSGESWYCRAISLKTAADLVFEAHLDAIKRLRSDRTSDRREFYTASTAISRDPKLMLFPVYMLLMGYALENAMKGIIITRTCLIDPQSICGSDLSSFQFPFNGKGQKKHITKHGLVDLCNAKVMSLTFGPDEIMIIKKLDEYIIWKGRYSVSKKYEAERSPCQCEIEFTDGSCKIVYPTYQKSLDELEKLYKKQNDNRKETSST